MADILAEDIFKCIFLKEDVCNLIEISLKFVPKGLIDNNSALVQIIAWCLTGDKPLPEPTMTQITYIYASPGLNQLQQEGFHYYELLTGNFNQKYFSPQNQPLDSTGWELANPWP